MRLFKRLIWAPFVFFFLFGYMNCSEGFNSYKLSRSHLGSSSENDTSTESPHTSLTQGPESRLRPAPPNTTPINLAQPSASTEFKCKPPRYYLYNLGPNQAKFLPCSPGIDNIFDLQIPDTGYAIARSSLVFRNNDTEKIYYWSVAVSVGTAEISYGQGDDVCPNSHTPVKNLLGYGLLNASNGSRVRVIGTQGSSACNNGQVSVLSGGTLEAWVEDPDPRCHKQDVNLKSSYQTIGSSKYYWGTSMNTLLSMPVPATPDRSRILVMSAVEGSPEKNPNSTCGAEAATLIAQATTNLQGIIDTQINVIPASQGMGHLVLSPQALASYSPSLNSISLLVGSNTDALVFTNDCCGDGKLGFVKLP